MAEARSIADNDVAAEAWRLLSEFNANLQRWDEALADLEIALQHKPGSRALRLRRALLLEQRGDSATALAELETLEREAAQSPEGNSPELLVHLGRALQYAGDTQASGTQDRSGAAPLAHGSVTAPVVSRAALATRRGTEATRRDRTGDRIDIRTSMRLRLVAADLLRSSGSSARALRVAGARARAGA